jgi:hypothetical protein
MPKSKIVKLEVDVKIGILHTIANAIYSTTAGKVREAVANALDNEATFVIIILDQSSKSLCIFDNGNGITDDRYQLIFKSIGYGLLHNHPDVKLSYFGLGLMSIFQLGKKVRVFTRPKGQNEISMLDVDTQTIFDIKNKEKSLSSLEDSITLSKSDVQMHKSASTPLLINELARRRFNTNTMNFTHIIISGLNSYDIELISGNVFLTELRQLLPLSIEKDEPFLQRITGKKGESIKQLLNEESYCKTVDVFFGIQEEGRELEQLYKYFPNFRSDIQFPDDNVIYGYSEDNNFAYYVLHSIAQDLHRDKTDERENGFWIRNQNFLVKSSDFLEKGAGRPTRIIDQPLRGWIFGEIFHKDMNSFLAVSRSDFLFDKDEFKEFRNDFSEIVNPLNKKLRSIWGKKKKIEVEIIEPFSNLTQPLGAMDKAETKLRDLINKNLGEEETLNKIMERLDQARNIEIEDENARVDVLLSNLQSPIKLIEDEEAVVTIDPAIKAKDYSVTWDAKSNKTIVAISPELFNPKRFVFLGQEFEIFFVVKKESDFGISMDTKNRKIYINPFNESLAHYSISILDVYIALYVAKSLSDDMDQLVKNTLALLGVTSDLTEEYISPLGDELRRTARLNQVVR